MPGIFSRLKNWVAEILTYSDLNAEIDNIIANFEPLKMDDYSTNLAQMQTQTDPGELSSESLATTLAGEVARLRYAINEIKGTTYWYQSSSYSLSSLGTALGGGLPNNRVISGKKRTTSSQAIALDPDGAATTIRLRGLSTTFRYVINGTEYSVTSDNELTGLVTAASTQNTCLVNDVGLSDQEFTKYMGEYGSSIIVDTMGTNISALIGRTAAFMVDNGVEQEYFIARVKSSTELDLAKRGYFFDDADLPVPRIAFSNNDTITLMKLTWIFINTTGALIPTYNEPRVSGTQPVGPSSGDYWFDVVNNQWKVFNATTWDTANVTFVGVCIQDSAATVAARTQEYFSAVSDVSSIELYIHDNTEVRSTAKNMQVSVNGTTLRYTEDQIRWDIDTDRDSGVSETASTTYFLYLTESGDSKISNVGPHDRTADLKGYYHPHQTWRCVGQCFNNASSNIEVALDYMPENQNNYAVTSSVSSNALTLGLHKALPFPLSFVNSGRAAEAAVLPEVSIIVSSGSTLGHRDTTEEPIYLHAMNVDGHVELVVSSCRHSTVDLHTTVAEGGAGGADLRNQIYSNVARTSKAMLPVARGLSTQTTAGTWTAALSSLSVKFDKYRDPNLITLLSGSMSLLVPAGVTRMRFFGCGGGGGGGSGRGSASAGAGGGGGGAPICTHEPFVVPGETIIATIGTGGTGGTGVGAATGNFGGTGTATTITSTTTFLTFPGGGGGAPGSDATATNGLNSIGSGGVGSGGGGGGGGGSHGAGGAASDTATSGAGIFGGGGAGGGETGGTGRIGGAGSNQFFYAGSAATGGTASGATAGGGGGGSAFGVGGNGGNAGGGAAGSAAANSGAGGGGSGSSAGTSAAGGNGGSGRLYISWDVD